MSSTHPIFQNFNHIPIASFTTNVNELINANEDNLLQTIPFPVTVKVSAELTKQNLNEKIYLWSI